MIRPFVMLAATALMVLALFHPPAFSKGAVNHSATATTTLSFLSGPEGIVAKRNFYVLTAAATDPEVLKAFSADHALADIAGSHSAALQESINSCEIAACLTASMRWSEDDIQSVSNELRSLYRSNVAIRSFVRTLRKSGFYPLYRNEDDQRLLVSAWTDAAKAMNRIIDVYGNGSMPQYGNVDRARFDTNAPAFSLDLKALAMLVSEEEAINRIFFFPEMKAAVTLLAMNDRLDAARFEPLQAGLNAAAITRARSVDWGKYPYSVIVVPGKGPAENNVRLSALGRIRVEQAVMLYRSGKAPFILVSGGAVHPMLTPFCEAMEMRRELIKAWNIPENAILVEPHARHTTTNLRNAVREIVRYGLPTDRPFLVTSDIAQVKMILSPAFDARCRKDLHYLPYTSKKKLSATVLAMRLNSNSLQHNATDPMDP